ncbi:MULTISPECIES: thioesterase II family protein [unclassified Streptomyces]|uniref:thioesterase II family protein n=1 Tax=unclassified Streptomyces TaxID=2593676 RepID=UPI00278BB59B|nr:MULTISPECIES: alpha/beta fold hydrolase [unclassified Streptomyces]
MSGSTATPSASVDAFVRPRPVHDPELRLVVFHHAGGSAAQYFPLTRAVPEGWDVLLLDLPGRGKRHGSRLLSSVAELVEVTVRDVLPWAGTAPLALFGHSLGALLAHETARVLEAVGRGPSWVGVSGRTPPGRAVPVALPDHELSDEQLMAQLTRMGGMHPRIDELPEFRERFLRLVRTDLGAVAGYRPDPARVPLSAPLTAFGGSDDIWAPPAALGGWAAETRGTFRVRYFEGGHFHFLGPEFPAFAAELVEEIRRSGAPTSDGRGKLLRTAT